MITNFLTIENINLIIFITKQNKQHYGMVQEPINTFEL